MLGAAHVSTTLSPGISTGWGHRELQGEAQQRLQGSQHHAVERWNLALGIENRTGDSLLNYSGPRRLLGRVVWSMQAN